MDKGLCERLHAIPKASKLNVSLHEYALYYIYTYSHYQIGTVNKKMIGKNLSREISFAASTFPISKSKSRNEKFY